jgi:hypothetical protein
MIKKINIFFIFVLSFSIVSCGTKTDDDTNDDTSSDISLITDWEINCLRWIDRDLYFATSDPTNPNRNNTFDKKTIQDIIRKIELESRLGENYFRFKTKNSELLQPIRPSNLNQQDYDSFILIWEDSKFEDFVNTNFGGLNNIPDRNAISIVNSKFKRKFYMIFRASCFDGEGGFSCGQLGIDGLNALVARQLGLVLQMPPVDCISSPNDVLCPESKDEQWNSQNRSSYYQALTSHLITIENNSNFYNDGAYASSCLEKPWMDKTLALASPNGQKNNTFFMQDVIESLNEISCSTILGCNYFSKEEQTTPESSIPFYFERTELAERSKSYVMIWPDVDINGFITDNDLSPADPNSVMFINQAYKRNFSLILRSSCFDANNALCDGGNGGITRDGLTALIARQLGLMVGLPIKDCTASPNHVMCAELPTDNQWSLSSKTQFFNQFNNALEFIGNNKDFYKELRIQLDNTDDLEDDE